MYDGIVLDAFSDKTYDFRITKRPKQSSGGNMVQAIQNIAFSATKKWGIQD